MKAYKRIKAIAKVVDDLISEGSVVADIGCDHGYLSELFDRNDKIKTVYAIDISKKCLSKVEKLKADFNLSKIVTICGNGIEKIEKADVCAIAGIGGLEIIKMLNTQNENKAGEKKCNIFVLQPAQNVFELRKWLLENKIFVIKDFLVEDAKKFYPIIAIDISKKQKHDYNLYNLFIGKDNDKTSEVVKNFIKFSLENFEYLQNISDEDIKKDAALTEKYQIYDMLKNINKHNGR